MLLFAGFQIDSREAWPFILGLISAISFFAWVGNQRRSRLILDTPTSRIASAAQGYVELTGRAKQAHDIPLLSKLTLLPCVWYRYIIEQQRSDEKGYDIVEQGTSDDTFLLDDGSGQCFIDPDYAEIITSHKQVWKKGDYRYTEYLLSPLDTLYAIGEFTTLGGPNSDLDFKGDLNALLAEWKRDKTRLQERFDLNKDGQIDPSEWELAVLAAKREVAKQHGEIRLKDGVHLLAQTRGRQAVPAFQPAGGKPGAEIRAVGRVPSADVHGSRRHRGLLAGHLRRPDSLPASLSDYPLQN